MTRRNPQGRQQQVWVERLTEALLAHGRLSHDEGLLGGLRQRHAQSSGERLNCSEIEVAAAEPRWALRAVAVHLAATRAI